MNRKTGTKFFAAIASIVGAAAFGGLSSGAQAADDPPPSKVVRFADLDISTSAGAAALLSRIRVAAQIVCYESAESDPILRMAGHRCIDEAIDNAVRKVNAPALTALRFGNPGMRLASK